MRHVLNLLCRFFENDFFSFFFVLSLFSTILSSLLFLRQSFFQLIYQLAFVYIAHHGSHSHTLTHTHHLNLSQNRKKKTNAQQLAFLQTKISLTAWNQQQNDSFYRKHLIAQFHFCLTKCAHISLPLSLLALSFFFLSSWLSTPLDPK